MQVDALKLEQIGQIECADVTFGDLTVFVGPQATGKSIFLQFLKLLADTGPVAKQLKRHGLQWDRQATTFLDTFLGEGMSGIWNEGQSKLTVNDHTVVPLQRLVQRPGPTKKESLFLIPAQRVITLARGWPRPFTDYSPGDPFVVRDFSEKLRLLLEEGQFRGEVLFPQSRRLKSEIRDLIDKTVFAGFGLRIDKERAQKRLVLGPAERASLPFMVWSAGQREFVPLLLGFYWLLPPTKTPRRAEIDWVVIEELEMGLHPRAISAAFLLVLDLLNRGYRVCLSTHSPHILDIVWAIKTIQQQEANPAYLLDLFEIDKHWTMVKLAQKVCQKELRVFYFDPSTKRTREISDLDPGAEDPGMAGWGGLSEFSGRVADVVANVVNHPMGH